MYNKMRISSERNKLCHTNKLPDLCLFFRRVQLALIFCAESSDINLVFNFNKVDLFKKQWKDIRAIGDSKVKRHRLASSAEKATNLTTEIYRTSLYTPMPLILTRMFPTPCQDKGHFSRDKGSSRCSNLLILSKIYIILPR